MKTLKILSLLIFVAVIILATANVIELCLQSKSNKNQQGMMCQISYLEDKIDKLEKETENLKQANITKYEPTIKVRIDTIDGKIVEEFYLDSVPKICGTAVKSITREICKQPVAKRKTKKSIKTTKTTADSTKTNQTTQPKTDSLTCDSSKIKIEIKIEEQFKDTTKNVVDMSNLELPFPSNPRTAFLNYAHKYKYKNPLFLDLQIRKKQVEKQIKWANREAIAGGIIGVGSLFIPAKKTTITDVTNVDQSNTTLVKTKTESVKHTIRPEKIVGLVLGLGLTTDGLLKGHKLRKALDKIDLQLQTTPETISFGAKINF